MKRLLLGFGLATGFAYATRELFGTPPPRPTWETDNDPEDLTQDLAQRARDDALVAVARKLITILNAIIRDRRPWQPIPARPTRQSLPCMGLIL